MELAELLCLFSCVHCLFAASFSEGKHFNSCNPTGQFFWNCPLAVQSFAEGSAYVLVLKLFTLVFSGSHI